MSKIHFPEIKDDEVRVISSLKEKETSDTDSNCPKPSVASRPESAVPPVRSRNHRPGVLWAFMVFVLVISILGICFLTIIYFNSMHSDEADDSYVISRKEVYDEETAKRLASASDAPFTVRTDTVVDGVKLTFLTPRNSTPTLEIGNNVVHDPTVVLAMQAADVRGDNGEIAGACVIKGELVSKGEAKAGFCSIIDGKISIGVAEATPMLEEALTNDGYFFRQYPLVVGGQIVENKPKGKAIRKALVETTDGFSVVISEERLTFHDFSKALVDAGVRNAIYLVGSNSLGSYRISRGRRFTFGKRWPILMENENYIVWR